MATPSSLSTHSSTHPARALGLGLGSRRLAVVVALAALCLVAFAGGPAWAGETGTLKLMVTTCNGSPRDNALVEVEIYRAGSGVIATDDDLTDDGYVEFTFTILEDGDLARVEVAACSGTESAHLYSWRSSSGDQSGLWDIEGTPDSVCEDIWWDEEENIIQLRCDE